MNNKKVYVAVSLGEKKINEFTARIIGFVDSKDVKAICNTKDSAKKIFHSDSYKYNELSSSLSCNKRVVFASSDHTDGKRLVILTPKVKYITFANGYKIFSCEGGRDYKIKESLYHSH